MIKRILIVDVETDGVEAEAKAIEIAMLLYSAEHHTTLAEFSTLCPAKSNGAERINRIPEAVLRDVGQDKFLLESGIIFAEALSDSADIVCAHNSEFDRRFLPSLSDKIWICSMSDMKWPLASRPTMKLTDLALDHGVPVVSAHRALTDCRLLAALFDKMDDLQGMCAVALRPKARFQAVVSYDNRQVAKDHGFVWDNIQRVWWRQMAIEDTKSLPFLVKQMRDEGGIN